MNRENLLKLAHALDNEITQEHFDMDDFTQDGDRFSKNLKTLCGTVACALGWAPLYVERPVSSDWDASGRFNYGKYCFRVFNLSDTEWDWCFDDGWTDTDNTPKGAAARIRHMLEHGAPLRPWTTSMYQDNLST